MIPKLHTVTVFCAAFLLFQVQTIMGRALLPWFGGTPAVWTTCMLFFQVLLLVGYAYAHAAASGLSPRGQAAIHLTLVGSAVGALLLTGYQWSAPLLPAVAWKPIHGGEPIRQILVILLVAVGLPYFVLSASSPLLQSWYARSTAGASPYRLYSASNIGSLLGLASYPIVVEPLLGLRGQSVAWCCGFLLFAVGTFLCALHLRGAPGTPITAEDPAPDVPPEPVKPGDVAMWLALAACGSTLLLAVTNQICQELSVFSLLWILPLAVYLVSFILCFDRSSWYSRSLFSWLLAGVMPLCPWIIQGGTVLPAVLVLGLLLLVLFICTMVCHGELVRLKPTPRHLTLFYLVVSLGGALGGVFVNLVAPLCFSGVWELQIGLWTCPLLLLLCLWRDRDSWAWNGKRWLPGAGLLPAAALYGWMVLQSPNDAMLQGIVVLVAASTGLAVVAIGSAVMRLSLVTKRQQPLTISLILLLACFGASLVLSGQTFNWARQAYRHRNFYGIIRVLDVGAVRLLAHGNCIHGYQERTEEHQGEPLGYYGRRTGIGLTWSRLAREKRPLTVGVVGLGTGSLAAYGRKGDVLRFYEIDPDVIAVAAGSSPLFSYYAHSAAHCETVLGDARVSLEHEMSLSAAPRYDLLVIDAFSGDTIPMHLLTLQALQLYLAQLKPDGLLAVHLSSRHLNLAPMLESLNVAAGCSSFYLWHRSEDAVGSASVWGIVGHEAGMRRVHDLATSREAFRMPASPRVWTDDHANVLQALLH